MTGLDTKYAALQVVSMLSKLRGRILGIVAFLAYLWLIYMIIALLSRTLGFVSLTLGTVEIVGFSIVVAIYIPTYTLSLIRRLKRAETTSAR